MKQHIPNLFTLGNLVCGSIAIVFTLEQSGFGAWVWLIFIAAFLDLLDGAVARALGVSGDLGKQLDSLADVVSFGLFPSVAAYMLLTDYYGAASYWPFIAFINVCCAAMRLAKFNISTDQTTDFRGMPSPANGLMWASLALLYANGSDYLIPPVIIAQVLISSLLMISGIRMFSFKFKGPLRSNPIQLTFLLLLPVLLATTFIFSATWITAIPLAFLLYIALSVVYHVRHKAG